MQCVGGGEITSDNNNGGSGMNHNMESMDMEGEPLEELQNMVRYLNDLYIWMFDLSILNWIMAAISGLLAIVPFVYYLSNALRLFNTRGPLHIASNIFMVLEIPLVLYFVGKFFWDILLEAWIWYKTIDFNDCYKKM